MASLPNQWIISVYSQVLLYSGNNKGKKEFIYLKKNINFLLKNPLSKSY